jgi:hypothetical protein
LDFPASSPTSDEPGLGSELVRSSGRGSGGVSVSDFSGSTSMAPEALPEAAAARLAFWRSRFARFASAFSSGVGALDHYPIPHAARIAWIIDRRTSKDNG